MTPEEHRLIFSLVLVPGRPYEGDRNKILEHFGTQDGRALGLRLLRDAIETKNADDVEAALIVCSAFGLGEEHLGLLIDLVRADWHFSHENIVSLLDGFRSPAAVEALYHAATWVPDYLEFDEARALAVKAIWALGNTPGSEAEHALRRLSTSDSEVVREEAKAQLARRLKRGS